MKWQASAPANIALIKYMGKTSATLNSPANASLSYTLDHLRTLVELELSANITQDRWEPLQNNQATLVPVLNSAAQQRYINHLIFIKKHFNFTDNFIIRSANNFPAGCGIASSASSFAALTLCAVNALTELTNWPALTLADIANLSRQGSGSSCRSLLGPWVLWQTHSVEKIELPYAHLLHQVVVISEQHKMVSSSEAHQRVVTSLLYNERNARAQHRLEQLLQAFKQKDWQLAYTITWQEFWDMHALFETAAKPFGYMQAGSLEVLDYLRSYWENNNDGPIVTMDAGPNVHILYRGDQKAMADVIKNELTKKYLVL
jgi:diphosphomevalonate decarboxylase